MQVIVYKGTNGQKVVLKSKNRNVVGFGKGALELIKAEVCFCHNFKKNTEVRGKQL